MATITFSNPAYKDKIVYATAGSHTDTILRIARENKIPINFDCNNGECASCVVKVTRFESKTPMAGPLTEKEKTVLLGLGKITQAEVEQMAVDDFPTPWRLACQVIARDEDILVEY
ncbi:MAG: 2Fe-2S iron-sulfur cluster binding domain-containing protein [Gammaproteobacteria bacterium]|nr:2Fe-2S iron-sulfur cluster binding domain-containing protein [Gammaproteobacteria bacterium]